VLALGVKQVERFEAYLGLPTLVGKAKYQTFSFLKDRVWKKLQGWKGMMQSGCPIHSNIYYGGISIR